LRPLTVHRKRRTGGDFNSASRPKSLWLQEAVPA
jgi:hypothetical protein